VGNSKRSKRQRRQKQRKVAVGTKKLTSFFVPVSNSDNSNDDSNNEDDKQQDIDDDSSEDEEEETLNVAWKDSQRLMDIIVLLEQQRQKATQKGESTVHSLRRSVVLAYLHLVKNGEKRQSASAMMATAINGKGAYYAKAIQNWANAFLRSGPIPMSEHGKHKKLGCFLRDEDV